MLLSSSQRSEKSGGLGGINERIMIKGIYLTSFNMCCNQTCA